MDGLDRSALCVPEPALVVLVGPPGCGKSTFARRHFRATEVVSSDACRAMIADDENDQSASAAAFQVLHLITGLRLQRRRLTVVDATNVRAHDRRGLVALARRQGVPAVAIVFDLPLEVCLARDRRRPGRSVGPPVVRAHLEELRLSLPRLPGEGFSRVHVLTAERADAAVIERAPSG